jgi:methionine salvage enolase-phosphatase E1
MKKKKEKNIKNEGLSLWERYKDKIVKAPEYKDSVKYIRKMRDKE